jgi:hypothetical protein
VLYHIIINLNLLFMYVRTYGCMYVCIYVCVTSKYFYVETVLLYCIFPYILTLILQVFRAILKKIMLLTFEIIHLKLN